uniref:Uncharacterized protein n=1 Tax=Anopheles funestus TaxID=62324 RepID=A0A182S0Y9_ANOFN
MKYVAALLVAIAYVFITLTSAESQHPREHHALNRHLLRQVEKEYKRPCTPGLYGKCWEPRKPPRPERLRAHGRRCLWGDCEQHGHNHHHG